MLFANRDKKYIASESRMREEILGGRRKKETFHTVIWTGRIKNPPETRIFPADFIIRITQVQAYRRPQHGSRI